NASDVSGLLDFDLAGDDLQLRSHTFERLPGRRFTLQVGSDRLVDECAVWEVRRDRPDRGPEMIGGRLGSARMWAETSVHLLAIRQFNDDTLESLVVERFAVLIEDAQAPHHF